MNFINFLDVKLINKQTALKIELTTFLDATFPEYNTAFNSGFHIPSFYAILKEFLLQIKLLVLKWISLLTSLRRLIRKNLE